MQPTTEENTWVRLVRKTRRFPLLYGTPIIRSSDDRVVIRDGWLQWFAAAIMTGFAALLVYVVLFHHNDMEHFAIVLCLSFGGFFT